MITGRVFRVIHLLRSARVALAAVFFVLAAALISAESAPDGISLSAWQQIQALVNEKRSWTPAQQKMDSHLIFALKKRRGQPLANGIQSLRNSVELDLAGKVLVDMHAKVTDALLATIKAGDGEVIGSFPQFQAIRARISLEQAELLAALPDVRFIHPASVAVTRKSTTSQGDVAHRANVARASFGATGTGVKVGVLSDSVDYLASVKATGDLPSTVTVLSGQSGVPGTGEGTAMLEIIYDLAPDAQLYFATGMGGQARMAQNILDLAAAGCNIIVDDIGYLDEAAFQDDLIAQAVTSVTATGVIYFSSAGNEGNLTHGTSGMWEGDFSAIAAPPVLGGTAHNFGGGLNYNTITVDSPSYFTLTWSDPTSGSANDYDLYLLDGTRTTLIDWSTITQSGTQDPFEYINSSAPYDDTGNTLVILRYFGSSRFLHLSANRGQFSAATAGQTSGHSAAASAFSVAAVDVATANGLAFTGGTTNPVEYFSSDGPRRIFYTANGTPITPGNFLATGGTVRQKPDIAAADGVACSTPGFGAFFGTSAAAPHAAAICALLKSRDPSLTPTQIRTRLTSFALDNEAAGVDRDSGWGIVDAVYTVTSVELISFGAAKYGNTVLLDWRTGFEVNNLGFNVYREDGGRLVKVNSDLIAGSALLAGPGTQLTAGGTYSWCDTAPAGASRYWLEDLDLSGKRTRHGPVALTVSDKPLPRKEQATLLAQVGREAAGKSSRIQAVRAKLSKSPLRGLELAASPLRPVVPPPPSQKAGAPQPEVQFALAGQSAVKLSVRQEGWYRVSQPQLVAAGLSAKADPRRLQLYVNGVEQAIVVAGERDGRFDPSDFIEFYGTGQDTPWTDAQVYWLVVGSKPGARVSEARATSKGPGTLASFPFTVERKDRTVYFAALKNGDADNFFGPVISTAGVDQTLSTPYPAASPAGNAAVEIALQGVTAGTHRVAILLNNIEIGTAVFDGLTRSVVRADVSSRALLEGDNLVTLAARGGDMDISLLDSVRITYARRYLADGNSLRCTAPGGQAVTIGGFSDPAVSVVDITDPVAPRRLLGSVESSGGTYAVTFRVPTRESRTLLAFAEAGVKQPAGIVANERSAWNQAGAGADVAILAHRSFLGAAGTLKALRAAQGYSVAVINVEDLYDEFNFGSKSPAALRDFLVCAKARWRTPPRFVTLLGDASVDPRNYLGAGDADFVPTKLVDTMVLETASDDWFVDLNGDDVPEMAVGRLPVRTAAEAAAVVAKIAAYEQSGAGDWTARALLVSDNNDVFDFQSANAEVGALLPKSLAVDGVFLGLAELGLARSMLLEKLNSGQLLVNYLGHGSQDRWAGEGLLTNDDVAALNNGSRLPFVIGMNCLNGFLQDPAKDCLAEAFLKAPRGGAVAVWASSGLTDARGQAGLDKELVRRLFGGSSPTLGEAILGAKSAAGNPDIRRTWILFGDPATRLK